MVMGWTPALWIAVHVLLLRRRFRLAVAVHGRSLFYYHVGFYHLIIPVDASQDEYLQAVEGVAISGLGVDTKPSSLI